MSVFISRFLVGGTLAVFFASILTCRTPSRTESSSEVLNWGFDNLQATLSFKGYFYMDPAKPGDSEAIDAERVDQTAHDTLEYLFGALRVHKAFVSNPGIPFGDPKWTITNTTLGEIDGKPVRKVEYEYTDLALFRKSMFQTWAAKQIRIVLPKDLRTLYKLAQVDSPDGKSKVNACTVDPHYDAAGDFFYFWSPDHPGCPPALKSEGTIEVVATIKPRPNTAVTFPEYGRLGSDKDIHVFVIQGVYHVLKENPEDKEGQGLIDKTDPGYPQFLAQMTEMGRLGFTTVKKEERYAMFSRMNQFGRKVTVEVALLSPSRHSRQPDRDTFTSFYQRAVRDGDIVIYNGHSGLGGTLRPTRFEKAGTPLEFNDRYQVFFFNGCSTYAYYRGSYMEKKGGSKNLDTISSGVSSWFPVQHLVTATTIEELALTQSNSWQQIVTNIYFAPGRKNLNAETFSANFSVNGDEDNPTTINAAWLKPQAKR